MPFAFSSYTGIVPSVRTCTVSFTDAEGISHSVSVTASSLFEAAAIGLAEFGRCGFAEVVLGPATKITVRVRQPEMSHTVTLARLRAWLDGVGKSPGEQATKSRLRGMIPSK
jgi:hypothetical protein